jgi:hypothetical protein
VFSLRCGLNSYILFRRVSTSNGYLLTDFVAKIIVVQLDKTSPPFIEP